MTTINRSLCKACQKPILWIRNENDRAEPFDAKPTRILRVAGDTDPDRAPVAFVEPGKLFEVKTGHLNHFLTCPSANAFRTKGKETP